MEEQTITIRSTTNYKMFKAIRGNREINKSHLKGLMESIQENNMLPNNPIIVNDSNYILDGQHRLEAAKLLRYPIYYTQVERGRLPEVQMLNSNARLWTTLDYLNSFIATGNEDYKYLKEFSEESGYSVSTCLRLLGAGSMNSHSDNLIKEFRLGDFKARFKEYASEFVKRLAEITPHLEEKLNHEREFLKAFDKVVKEVGYKRLKEKIESSGYRFTRQTTIKGYIRCFEDVLSWKRKNLVRIGR